MAPATLHVIAVIGAATALLAATIALAQNDIKKVLAYSTVSQLGYMFLAMGVGAYGAGIFHLMTHAFFKACLFLGSGSVIHAMGGEQDMRKMGGLWSKLPHTSKTFLIATLALTGFPFLAGFFSKDEILWQAYSSHHGHWVLWAIATLVAGLTAFYMFRQVFMVFFGECRADHETQHHLHESPSSMTTPLWILAVGSILVGYFGVPHSLGGFVGIPHVFNDWLAPVMGAHGVENETHPAGGELALELGLMAVSVAVAFTGIFLAYLMYYARRIQPETFSELAGGAPYRVLLNKYYVDELYDLVFVRGTLALCNAAAWFDRNVIDGIVNGAAVVVRGISQVGGLIDKYIVDGAVNGVADVTWAIGRRARAVQTGAITSYLFVVAIGVLGGVFLYWSWASAY
jgi:NADH-quinone oxidoreductase subunit L